MNKARKPGTLKRALEFAQQATERDPSYAPAYVALGRANLALRDDGWLSNREANMRAKVAATKAFEIDESLPEAPMALADVRALLSEAAATHQNHEVSIL